MITDEIEDFLCRNKLTVKIVGEFTDSGLVRVTIERGGAIGFLPLSVARKGLASKSLVKLGELTDLHFTLWAITQKNFKDDILIESLIKNYRYKKENV
jgi:DNA-binding transcriptional LysR family regulator